MDGGRAMSRHATIQVRPQTPVTEFDWSVYRDRPSEWPHYLRLVAANGQVLAHSENYANRRNARRAVKAWAEAFDDLLTDNVPPSIWPQWVVEFDADGNEVQR